MNQLGDSKAGVFTSKGQRHGEHVTGVRTLPDPSGPMSARAYARPSSFVTETLVAARQPS